MCIGHTTKIFNRPTGINSVSTCEVSSSVMLATISSLALVTLGTLALIGLSSPTSSLGFLGSTIGQTGAYMSLMAGCVPILATLISTALQKNVREELGLPASVGMSGIATVAAVGLIVFGAMALAGVPATGLGILGGQAVGYIAIATGLNPLIFVVSKRALEARNQELNSDERVFSTSKRARVITAVAVVTVAALAALAFVGVYAPTSQLGFLGTALGSTGAHLACATGLIALLAYFLPFRTENATLYTTRMNDDSIFKHLPTTTSFLSGVVSVGLVALGAVALNTSLLPATTCYALLAAGVTPILMTGVHSWHRKVDSQKIVEKCIWAYVSQIQ